MIAQGQTPFCASARRLLRFGFAVAFCLSTFAACRKPPSDAALDAPLKLRKGQPAWTPAAAPLSGEPPASPPPFLVPAFAPKPETDNRAGEAAKLAAEFRRPDIDEVRRVEVISELAVNGSPAARQMLNRIFRTAGSVGVKQEVIEALRLIDEGEDLEPSLLLLQEAVAAGQDPELRAAAIDTLHDLPSPKTIRIWQTLLADRDAAIREEAKKMIEFLMGEGAR